MDLEGSSASCWWRHNSGEEAMDLIELVLVKESERNRTLPKSVTYTLNCRSDSCILLQHGSFQVRNSRAWYKKKKFAIALCHPSNLLSWHLIHSSGALVSEEMCGYRWRWLCCEALAEERAKGLVFGGGKRVDIKMQAVLFKTRQSIGT